MRRRVSTEKLRYSLREIQQAHGDMDAREEARRAAAAEKATREAEARAAAERERQAARAKAAFDAYARRTAEEAQERRKTKRREAIQRVKHKVVDEWWGGIGMAATLKAQMLQAIEAELTPLPADELPETELVQVAEGIRDRIYGQAVAAQQAATARLQRKQVLQQYGLEYAQKELREIDGLKLSERWRIEALVKDDLESLRGDESRADVRERVEAILDEEGLGMDDEDEDEDE
jgi:predicted GNAT family acetyltransferase